MFKTLQKTLRNVQRDVSTGLKSLTTKSSPEDETSEEDDLEIYGLDVDAGAQLLNRFQEGWTEIHLKSEENAKKAKAVDTQIGDLFLYLERQNDAISQFLNEVSVLPSLIQDIQGINEKLARIETTFESVETSLVALEDLCEHVTLEKNKRHHNYQLSMYQQKKNVSLEKLKVRLAAEHSQKVKAYERELQDRLREKQQAFEATYREEMKHYQQFGETSVSFKPTSGENHEVNLADISVTDDTDQMALNDFLQSEEKTDMGDPLTAEAESNQKDDNGFKTTPAVGNCVTESPLQPDSAKHAEEQPTETPSAEEPPTETPSAEEPPTETLSAEEPPTETPSAGEPPTETPSGEEPQTEITIAGSSGRLETGSVYPETPAAADETRNENTGATSGKKLNTENNEVSRKVVGTADANK